MNEIEEEKRLRFTIPIKLNSFLLTASASVFVFYRSTIADELFMIAMITVFGGLWLLANSAITGMLEELADRLSNGNSISWKFWFTAIDMIAIPAMWVIVYFIRNYL